MDTRLPTGTKEESQNFALPPSPSAPVKLVPRANRFYHTTAIAYLEGWKDALQQRTEPAAITIQEQSITTMAKALLEADIKLTAAREEVKTLKTKLAHADDFIRKFTKSSREEAEKLRKALQEICDMLDFSRAVPVNAPSPEARKKTAIARSYLTARTALKTWGKGK